MVLVGPLVSHFLQIGPPFLTGNLRVKSSFKFHFSPKNGDWLKSGSPRGREGSRQRHCTRTQNIADDWKWNRVLKCHPKRRNQHHGRLMTTGGIIKLMSYVDIHTHIYIYLHKSIWDLTKHAEQTHVGMCNKCNWYCSCSCCCRWWQLVLSLLCVILLTNIRSQNWAKGQFAGNHHIRW